MLGRSAIVDFSPVAAALALALAALAAGCDCGGGLNPGGRCTTSRDCRDPGDVCIDGRCTPRDEIDGDVPDEDAGGGGCVDFDRDGLGLGCPAGPDCDDRDPARGGPERCDDVDNDCDGTIDEGLRDICTTCTPSCEVDVVPGTGGWMPDAENSDGVIVDPSGALTLGRTMAMAFSVWVANSDEATVSRLRFDSSSGRIVETGRFPTVGVTAPAGSRPWNEQCGWCDPARGGCIGNCPSRTAVDQNFDAYVANRAFGNQGTITKFANDEADCVDRNMNGVIDTSRDLNGDGTIALTPVGIGNEFVGPEDECILYTVPVGSATGGTPRALAIGIAAPDAIVGDVWVGLYNDQQACLLRAADGSIVACMPIDGIRPYGAASDAMGRIWFVDRTGTRRDILGYVSPSTMTFHGASDVPDFGCATGNLQAYGITPDADGRIYVASSNCDPPVLRYVPETDTWDSYTIPGGGTPRGLAADETSLWVGLSHSAIGFGGGWGNRVAQFSITPTGLSFVANHTIPTGLGPVGVGVSFDGSVWAVCQGSNSAARLDPAAGTWLEQGVGLTPYTYSDFIGFGLNVFAEPRGRYKFRLEGCEGGEFGGQTWLGARVTAEIPPRTEVTLWARTADDVAALAALPWIGPFPAPVADFRMAPGPLAPGRYIEIELRLRTDDRRVAPRVMRVDVAGECTAPSTP